LKKKYLRVLHVKVVFFLTVKVPQIVKLYRAQSGEGINVLGLMMELFGMVANIAYSYRNEFPFR